MPNAKINANILTTFSVIPSDGINKIAPIKETGIPRETQAATDGLRNKVNNKITNNPPCHALRMSVLRRPFTTFERSRQKDMLTPSGNEDS